MLIEQKHNFDDNYQTATDEQYLPNSTTTVKEALMLGNTESDYLQLMNSCV